ncbi:MAG: hypothetical protein U0183_24655 [Polyangiaceae bacterium]
MFRRSSFVALADHDLVNDVAWLSEVQDDGSATTTHTHAVAGRGCTTSLSTGNPTRTRCAAGPSLGGRPLITMARRGVAVQ